MLDMKPSSKFLLIEFSSGGWYQTEREGERDSDYYEKGVE